ncbi:hypothetical protein PGH07_01715 [Sulfurovum sp. zt1-1]|uniref:Tellurite resistance protein TerB n=1 Tax=Sulfurovum zhangzhouensis TaxID=3019067 RepID=A0ABT7QVM1_9BACT|nr:hypothetical protein [Sulfurovum zhangzhouensis]MDM5270890.1 hypothetical protein [Sulfurovum zhangzhouensis]
MIYQIDKLFDLAKVLDPFERTCAITVALKIVDESCKMDEYEKSIFMMLYENLENPLSDFFDEEIHDLIENIQLFPSDELFSRISEEKQKAMDYITRPKMKAFKASVRARIL